MLVTLITPTGSRPQAFQQCEKYVARQTYKGPLQWIVVDDCDPPTPVTMGQEYIRGPMLWKEGINTQRPNMDAALAKVKGDCVFVIEDDDWYSPIYLEYMIALLKYYPLVGEGNSKYYHVAQQTHMENLNTKNVSLCQTGVRKDILDRLYSAVHSGDLYFDIQLWSSAVANHIPRAIIHDKNLTIGMKGLPGRGGIGKGHKMKGMFDLNFKTLEEWVGKEDAEFYKEFSLFKSDKTLGLVDNIASLKH